MLKPAIAHQNASTYPELPVSLRNADDFCGERFTGQLLTPEPAHDFDANQAVADHLSMVRFIARQIHRRLPGHVELEDLVSAGSLGLMDAAAKFEGKKQVQFRSYAQFRVRGAILDSLRTMDWSPRALRRQARAIEQAVRNLYEKGLLTPTDADVAEEMGLTLTSYQKVLGELKGLELGSLQMERNEDTGEQEIGYVTAPASEDPLFRCLQGEMRQRLAAAIDTLPEKERLLLSLYYYEELTMKEISQVLGVVESRVSQMHSSAVVRLRAALAIRSKDGICVAPVAEKKATRVRKL